MGITGRLLKDCSTDPETSGHSRFSIRVTNAGEPFGCVFQESLLWMRAFALGGIPSGRCEEIEKFVWGNFGSKKSRARIPSKRSLGLRHTFCISLNFDQIDFFTSSRRDDYSL
jgi:hypothetical protein